MRAFTFIFAAVLVTLKVNAQDIIVFSGDQCDDPLGGEAPCDGSCISFSGRHSYEITGSSDACVTLFVGDGCTGQSFASGPEAPGECNILNIGIDFESLSCVPC
ncbi:hypothetical protein C8J56DRAFT_1083219 [Mycena floridula]|nr:hypothetical protein C8J56DRAFT_1083219 [Mycena floridula]